MNESYKALFERLREIRGGQARRKTFMDVSGYPHYENVVSNILAFLFDDSEEHGMKNLWLGSLLALVVPETSRIETQNITVRREVYTDKGNRIDLLIKSDDYVVCIENKIFSGVGNDLIDYRDTTKKELDPEKELVCIVLSLTPADYREKQVFKNVLYVDLFSEVKKRLGEYMDAADNTWLIYVKDFIATIESLTGGNEVNTEFEVLYREFFSDIRKLEESKGHFMACIKQEAETVLQYLKDQWEPLCNEIGYPLSIKLWENPYQAKSEMRVSVVIDFNLNASGGRVVTLETIRDAWGWHFSLYKRKGKLDNLINAFPKRVHPSGDNIYGSQYIIESFASCASSERVAERTCEKIKELIPVFKKYMD